MRAALGTERDACWRTGEDELAARIDAVDQRVEAAADERVVDGADGQQQLAVELVAEAELAEQHEQVHLADAQLNVLAAWPGLPAQEARDGRRRRLPRVFGPDAGAVDPAAQVGRDGNGGAGCDQALR